MPKQTHTSLRNAIVQLLTSFGIFCWANETTGMWDAKRGAYRANRKRLRGVSDILGVLRDGRFLAIEVKVGRDKCSEAQEHFIATITARNGVAFVARSVDDVLSHFGMEDQVRDGHKAAKAKEGDEGHPTGAD